MKHLTLRVAWHDNRWDGTVCRAPLRNCFCVELDRIREKREEDKEELVKGRPWGELPEDQLPPCVAESGGFMNPSEWTRVIPHPYADIEKAKETHGHLKPTYVKVPPYSAFATPFWWMLRENQEEIDQSLPEPLPPDEESPFNSSWVFGSERQRALSKLFFSRISEGKSLALFYCKQGHPLGDALPRLVVGIGRVVKLGPEQDYKCDRPPRYPLWDRLVRHSIRPGGMDGFLLPYHEYLAPTGDSDEDARRLQLAAEIAVAPDPSQMRSFSYGAELCDPDVALSALARCLAAVRKIREHGIVKGPWEEREEWLNEQIAGAWRDRGAFPSLGPALEAMGMRLGTALALELQASGAVTTDADPWPVVDAVIRGKRKPPSKAYEADIRAVRATWIGLADERRNLLLLLSRFALTPGQAKRWFDERKRAAALRCVVRDTEVLANPYRVAELDIKEEEPAVSVGVLDRGLLPDSTVAAKHPVPEPSRVGAASDGRRVRAALVSVLRQAAEEGDSLLGVNEALDRVESLGLTPPCNVTADWIRANGALLGGVVEVLEVPSASATGGSATAVQLTELKDRERRLARILQARAAKKLPSLQADWRHLMVDAVQNAGGEFDPESPRHVAARENQADALERITTRKLSVLVGKAGTGKTSALGALLLCEKLARQGILLLAPTGKARVRLGGLAGSEAMTVAQFLYSCGRYDGIHQRPLFEGSKYRSEKTVVIDECSMLTMDDLLAVLEALDLAHVRRIVLVGDPNQLPPIGVGRPFADFAGLLERAGESEDARIRDLEGAIGRVTVEVRTTADEPSDTLRLAAWFTRGAQSVGADRILSQLALGEEFNDLEVCYWKTPDELREKMLDQFQKHLGLAGIRDVAGFNKALGLDDKGWVRFDAPEGAENFQILSPVRMHPHGAHELNRWIQSAFRPEELKKARKRWAPSLGDEEIVYRDKVIQVRNMRRNAYDGNSTSKVYLANGDVGLVTTGKSGWLNVVFARLPGLRVGYGGWDFPGGNGPLELAYALTIHKAQGSEFRTVFVVLPRNSRPLCRELIYTALTRSRDRLVLLIEGDDVGLLYDLSSADRSDTVRRNTNLFYGCVRQETGEIPFAQHLIHRTERGELVRSKSELVIANMLYHMGIECKYERRYEGAAEPGWALPDFSFVDPAGDLILWEHLGMMSRPGYREGWQWKLTWYQKNGFIPDENLFTTEDDERGGLDSTAVRQTAERIQALL